MLFKLFATTNGGSIRTLKTQFKNPIFLTLTSHFHNLNKNLLSNPAIKFLLDEADALQSAPPADPKPQYQPRIAEKSEPNVLKDSSLVQITHPWPEWVELMELLLKKGYFEGIGNPFERSELGSKDANQIRTACLNFARDRSELIRYLSRKDIVVITESGCPSIDRKVVNSGKRLRAHVGIDEGNVCSSCILRGNCERAYVKAHEYEGGRTVDVMRFLLTYGLDPIIGSVENRPCLNKKVKESVKRLLKEMVAYRVRELERSPVEATFSKGNSAMQENTTHQGQGQLKVPMKQGDWICPKCNFLNFARNVRCLRCDGLFQERLRKLREDQDHLPLKKGDWICDKCNFLNFAKNTRCFQCKEKPPKRQLNPGEWECESCNYINFRKNMVCLKCDHRRSKASNSQDSSSQHVNDGGGFHRLRPYFGLDHHIGNGRVGQWKFVEDEAQDEDGANSLDEVPEFVDFPIAGGKSDLSRDVQKQEQWRREMAEKCRDAARAKENADEFKSSIINSSSLLGSTDDEEMAEWFGHGRNAKIHGSV